MKNEFIKKDIKRCFNNITFEWCSVCQEEVEIPAVLKIQQCPNCHGSIIPCSLCEKTTECYNCPIKK